MVIIISRAKGGKIYLTDVEKRLITEILSLSLESRAQLMEIIAQSMDENYDENLKAVLREIYDRKQE